MSYGQFAVCRPDLSKLWPVSQLWPPPVSLVALGTESNKLTLQLFCSPHHHLHPHRIGRSSWPPGVLTLSDVALSEKSLDTPAGDIRRGNFSGAGRPLGQVPREGGCSRASFPPLWTDAAAVAGSHFQAAPVESRHQMNHRIVRPSPATSSEVDSSLGFRRGWWLLCT